MADAKNSTTKKVLRTQLRTMSWTMFVTDLLVLALVFGSWLVLQMMDYAGGLEALSNSRFTQVWIDADIVSPPNLTGIRFWLTLEATGLRPVTRNVTEELGILLAGLLIFWIIQRLFRGIIQTIGRRRVKAHMQQVTQLAQEARQLGEEAAKRQAPKPAPKAAPAPAAAPAGKGENINAPMPGNILDVRVANGQAVKSGDILMILEAMKMENEIIAPCAGTVSNLSVQKGSTVSSGQLLCSIG